LNTHETTGPSYTLKKKSRGTRKGSLDKIVLYSDVFPTAIWRFLMLPNYNQSKNLGPLIVTAISFAIFIGGYAIPVFQQFGEMRVQKKIKPLMD
jgi:hypothetical protein